MIKEWVKPKNSRHARAPGLQVGGIALLVLLFLGSSAGMSASRVQADDKTEAELSSTKEANASKYSDGGTVPTNPQLEELLRRARLFADDGGFRNATILWSKVLSEGGSSLVTQDGETYQSLASVVEQEIAKLPADGLQAYRIIADGEAQALLAQGPERGQAQVLREIVDRYFMSGLGDQAAFDLAGLAMDEFDMVTATRLLERIVQTHPDPDVDLGMVFLRLAVCYSGLRQPTKAKQAFQTALQAETPVSPELLEQVSRFMNAGVVESNAALAATADVWPMPYGTGRRDGVMPALPPEFFQSDLTIVGQTDLDMTMTANQVLSPYQANRGGGDKQVVNANRESLLVEWETNKYQPTQLALVTPEGVIVKSARNPTSWEFDPSTGLQLRWESLWYNNYRLDDHTSARVLNQQMYGGGVPSSGGPSQPLQVFLFGDRAHQSMAAIGDAVYVVEGQPYAKREKLPGVRTNQNQQGFWGPQALRRSRTNWLTAYDHRTGKLLWHRAASEQDDDAAAADDAEADPVNPNALLQSQVVDNGVGFIGPPVDAGELLLLPVTHGGSIWVYGLAADTGATRWKTHLCDEPSVGVAPWATVYIAVDGQDGYVCCGAGVLFSLNVADGRLRFARRYERSVKGARQANPNFGNQVPVASRFDGWMDDLIVPYEGVLVVLPSDSNQMLAFDRSTGEFVWAAPRQPFSDPMEYCLGVRGRFLYAAGQESVLCYDLAGQGRLIWRETFRGPSLARGCLTTDSILIPVKDSISQFLFDPDNSGKATRGTQVGVKGMGGEPVGNLVSDGQRLWAVQPGRLLVLAGTTGQLDQLNLRIEQGDIDARWERLQIALQRQPALDWQEDWEAILRERSRLSTALIYDMASLTWLERTGTKPEEHPAAREFLRALATRDRQEPGWIDWSSARARRPLIRQLLESSETVSSSDLPVWTHVALQSDDAPWLTDWLRTRLAADDRRQAAAHFLGQSEELQQWIGIQLLESPLSEETIQHLINLASTSRESEVNETLRLAATMTLLRHRQTTGVDSGLQLMTSADPRVRQTAFLAVVTATGRAWHFDALSPETDRQLAWDRIQAEWQASRNEISWKSLPDPLPISFRRIVAGFPRTGELVEFSETGKVLRSTTVEGLLECLGCENGDLWVATGDHLNRLAPDQSVLLSLELEARPVSLAPLPNDGVLVCSGEFPGRVQAFDRSGQLAWQRDLGLHGLAAAWATPEDTLLISSLLTGQMLELSPQGETVRELPVLTVSGITRLDSGNLLLTSSLNGEVLELNHERRTVFKRRSLPQARDAIRIAEGATVVAYAQGLIALDRDGNELWTYNDKGAAITVANY